jgi:hypothetical protein
VRDAASGCSQNVKDGSELLLTRDVMHFEYSNAGVPIVLVVTHIDCVTARELEEQVAWVQRVAQENSEKITLLNDGISYRINCRSVSTLLHFCNFYSIHWLANTNDVDR